MSASTAEWDGIIRGIGIGAAEQPVDALRARILRSNLCHAADSYGQVRSCWVAAPALGVQPIEFAPSSSIRHVHTVGPWPAPLRHDGRPYALRVRIAVHVDSGQVDLYAVYGPARPPSPREVASLAAAVSPSLAEWTGETHTSATWLDGALLQMSAAQAREAMATTSTVDHAGRPAAVDQCLVALHIYAAGTAGEAWLDGIYAAEWQGDVTP